MSKHKQQTIAKKEKQGGGRRGMRRGELRRRLTSLGYL
jgi:hypothetical protein